MVLTTILILSSAITSVHSFTPPIARPFIHHQINPISRNAQLSQLQLQPLFSSTSMSDTNESSDSSSSIDNKTANDAGTTTSTTEEVLSEGVQKVFSIVDIDNSGTIDWNEYYLALSSTDYTNEEITESFKEIDIDGNGEISRDEFQKAIAKLKTEKMNRRSSKGSATEDDCPLGYWLNSVEQTCQPLGPIGRFSQQIETLPRFKSISKRISTLFGIDRAAIRKKGVSFALAYSIISNLNGALSLSVAWYMTVKRVSRYVVHVMLLLCVVLVRLLLYVHIPHPLFVCLYSTQTGISPLAPGQKKALLASYAMIYGVLQLLKPFRVAMAIGMSKASAEYLEMTQERFNCSRGVAIGCQYMMGQLMMGITFFAGVSIVSLITGVPIRG